MRDIAMLLEIGHVVLIASMSALSPSIIILIVFVMVLMVIVGLMVVVVVMALSMATIGKFDQQGFDATFA